MFDGALLTDNKVCTVFSDSEGDFTACLFKSVLRLMNNGAKDYLPDLIDLALAPVA